MTAARTALDFYIDANLILLLSLILWLGVKGSFSVLRLRLSYLAQLRLLQAVLVATLLSPLLSLGVTALATNTFPGTSLNATDLAVASYLRGDFDMKAIEFEALLNTRESLTLAFLNQSAAWAQVLALMLAVGVALCAVRLAGAAIRLRRIIARSFVWRRTARVSILLSDQVPIPFAARGLLRSYIVLPSDILTRPDDLAIALAHEVQHIRHGDTLTEQIMELLRPLFFWNPGYLAWKHQLSTYQELACDERVLERLRISTRNYAHCLLRFCENSLSRRGAAPGGLNVALVRWRSGAAGRAAKTGLRRRILSLRDRRPEKRFHCLVCSAAMLAVFVVLSLGAASLQDAGDWSQDRLMLSTVVNLERLELINRR